MYFDKNLIIFKNTLSYLILAKWYRCRVALTTTEHAVIGHSICGPLSRYLWSTLSLPQNNDLSFDAYIMLLPEATSYSILKRIRSSERILSVGNIIFKTYTMGMNNFYRAALLCQLFVLLERLAEGRSIDADGSTCALKNVTYNYYHAESDMECRAAVVLQACGGQCSTGYSYETGRQCVACQPTSVRRFKEDIDCDGMGDKSIKAVYFHSAVECKCTKFACSKHALQMPG